MKKLSKLFYNGPQVVDEEMVAQITKITKF